MLGAHFWLLLHIDDPVNAGPLHLGCGLWGPIATGLFLHPDRVLPGLPNGGVVYGWDADAFIFFGIQVIGCATIIAWSIFVSGSFFLLMRVIGHLRVPKAAEEEGLDYKNGEPAYPLDPSILEDSSRSRESNSV